MMKVLKFGGSSVSSVSNIRTIKNIVDNDDEKKIVVCSAMSGVTDSLYRLIENIRVNDRRAIARNLDALCSKHLDFIDELIDDELVNNLLKDKISVQISKLYRLCKSGYSDTNNSIIITYGELLLTTILSEYLNWQQVFNVFLNAKDFMYVDFVDMPNVEKVSRRLDGVLHNAAKSNLYITQGFVCRTKDCRVSHLERGGSDYSATIIAAAVNAVEVQIWTDISGLHNNDPRYVSGTFPVPQISYNEAADLAYYGAKILHPKTVFPVLEKEIPIVLKNTFDPSSSGTTISSKTVTKGLKSIAAKDGITLLNLKSTGVLTSEGFYKVISEILEKYNVSSDMIKGSETEISLTIDKIRFVNEVIYDLHPFATVSVHPNHSIICVVGDSVMNDESTSRLIEIINKMPVVMASNENPDKVLVLVETNDKVKSLRFLNEQLFPAPYAVA